MNIRRPDVSKLFGRAPLAIVRSSGATHHSDGVQWVRTICDAGALLQAAKLYWTTLLSVRLRQRLCGSQNDTNKTSGLFAHRTERHGRQFRTVFNRMPSLLASPAPCRTLRAASGISVSDLQRVTVRYFTAQRPRLFSLKPTPC